MTFKWLNLSLVFCSIKTRNAPIVKALQFLTFQYRMESHFAKSVPKFTNSNFRERQSAGSGRSTKETGGKTNLSRFLMEATTSSMSSWLSTISTRLYMINTTRKQLITIENGFKRQRLCLVLARSKLRSKKTLNKIQTLK